jgi:hypothetical protein
MKQLYTIKKNHWLVILLLVLSWTSCKVEQIAPAAEAAKDITGNWKVIAATRNGSDLTTLIDFSQFKLTFSGNAYTLVNKLPFLVSQNGTYSLDDPQYPFQITFTATGGKAVPTSFTYPIVNGVRRMILTFSPGCPNNTYIYTFQKAN